jgi:hypothetical protein
MTDRTQWNTVRNRLHQLLYRITRDDLPDRVNTLDAHMRWVTDDAAVFTDAQLADWVGAVVDKVLFIPSADPLTADALGHAVEQTNPEVDWAVGALRRGQMLTDSDMTRLADLVVALRRMAYAKVLGDAPVADPVAQFVDSMTPPDLARRPGDLLKDAVAYALGVSSMEGVTSEQWAMAADQFANLMAQGAQPLPTDLPMDGSDPTDRQLLDRAVRALEDFGEERTLAGGYKEDRLARMAAALQTATWLRACMANDPGKAGAAVRDRLRLHVPADAPHIRIPVSARFQPDDAHADPFDVLGSAKADNGELPRPQDSQPAVPPMVGRWDMVEWDADNRVTQQPAGLEPDTMVVVSHDADGPYQLDRAGSFFWGPNALCGNTIRWWRRASEQEVRLGKPLQKTRTTTFPMADTSRPRYQVRQSAGIPDGLTAREEWAWVGAPATPCTPQWAATVEKRLQDMAATLSSMDGAAAGRLDALEAFVRYMAGKGPQVPVPGLVE